MIAIATGMLLMLAIVACNGNTSDGSESSVTIDTTAVDTTSPEGKIRILTERLKFGPENWRLWMERSQQLYELGNIPRALSDIEKAIQYSITEPETYYLRGFYLFAQKQDSLAMRDFKRAADLDSKNPENYHLIGNLNLLQGKYAEADEAYDYAIKLDSMEPTYYFAKGVLRQQQRKIDEAIRWHDKALQRDPTFIKALLALHDIFLKEKKNPDQAYMFNERVMLVDSTQPLAHFNQGNFFIVRANLVTDPGKMADFQVLMKIALSEYNLCLKYDPKFVPALYSRGFTFYSLEKYGQALSDFNKVTELDPFHRDGFYMKANIQEFQGDLSSALENYRRALEIDPKFSDAAVAVKELTAKLQK
ncbi:MAG TPA: tetratricopeptide repeat protein [Bacteroidia bacterium]|nr:tetratricopeptide repeat protein [Bacteroidia bacterium]